MSRQFNTCTSPLRADSSAAWRASSSSRRSGRRGRTCSQYDHGDVKVRHVLLVRRILVDCQKDIKLRGGQSQQRSVLNMFPAELLYRSRVISTQVTQQTPINALVNQHLHSAYANTLALVSSKKAMTCSRLTDGKPLRKSSIESPASRCSISVCASTRVPLNTGAPLITPGSAEMTELSCASKRAASSARSFSGNFNASFSRVVASRVIETV